MAFNVDTATISLYLAAEAGFNAGSEEQEKLLYALYCFAMKRPLSRQLANQEFPHNLERILRPGGHNGPWVHAALERGEAVWQFRPDDRLSAEISHVADWITAAVHNDEPWLQHRNPGGAPHKLLKLGSLQQAVHEADKAMTRRNASMPAHLAPEHFATVKTFPDGAKIVRLLTPQALDAESAQMGHCVGHGAYDAKLEKAVCNFFSLRSPSGKARATLEVNTFHNALIQCRGRQNQAPIPKYTPYIRDFVDEQQLRLNESPMMTGLVRSGERTYDVHNLPNNFRYDGDLTLTGTRIQKLPDGLTVTGNLDVSGTDLKALPRGLHVGGVLRACYTKITAIPSDMTVRGHIDLSHTKLAAVPPGFRAPGWLDLSHTPLKELPAAISIGKSLYVDRTHLRSLPESLHIPNALSIQGAVIDTLPRSMSIGETVVIDADTRLPHLPTYFSGKIHLWNVRAPRLLTLGSYPIESERTPTCPQHRDNEPTF